MSKKRILLVDDEVAFVEVVKKRLEFHGFDILTAHDGQTALEISREEHPDLILLDLMLPKLDGYKVCKILKFDENFKDIPIILLTALTQESDIKLGYEIGADLYMTKPFDSEELLKNINELIEKSETA